MSGKIAKLESEIKTSQDLDTTAVIELLGAYQNFSAKYPDDSLAPVYLYKTAGLAMGLNRGKQAIGLYESVIQNFPEYKRIPECYFMLAFAYENMLGNTGKANELYNEFLIKYSDHELADDARTAIKFLGKSPVEIVSDLDKLNADTIRELMDK